MIVKQNSDFLRFQGASQQDTDGNPDRLTAKRKSECDSIHQEPDCPLSTFDHRRAQMVNGMDPLLSPWRSRGARVVAKGRMSALRTIDLYGLDAEKYALSLFIFIRFSHNPHRRFVHP